MQIGNIEGSNLTMKGDGISVADLRVVINRDESTFTSAWLPTPAELMALVQGEPVYLRIWSDTHPPVFIGVKGVTI